MKRMNEEIRKAFLGTWLLEWISRPEHLYADFRDEDAQIALGMTEEEYFLAQQWNLERDTIRRIDERLH